MSETEQVVCCPNEKEFHSLELVRHYMWWSLGAGLIPVPIIDMVALSGVQLKMIAEIAKVYGIEFRANRVRAIIGALLGSILPEVAATAVATFLKALPTVGGLAGGTMVFTAGGATWALGKVFIQHFESGGTFLDLEPREVRAYFKAQFEEGKKMAATQKHEEHA